MALRLSARSAVVKTRVLALLLLAAGVLATRVLATSSFFSPAVTIETAPPLCGSGVTFSPAGLLAKGVIGMSYSQTLTPRGGGTAPHIFGIVSGSLPAGLSLSPAGVISGIPTTTGKMSATVLVLDAMGCAGNQELVIAVNSQANATGVNVADASGIVR